jgi:hypothetical protein
VAVTAPAAFRWTYASNPRKHVLAAELLTDGPVEDDDEDTFPAAFAALMRDVGAPPSLGASATARATSTPSPPARRPSTACSP